MYNEQEPDESLTASSGEETAGKNETDDGFEDDIPWGKDAPPKKPPRKTAGRSAGRSLSEEFQNRISKEAATGSGELDIY
jgi:hypothetical protein